MTDLRRKDAAMMTPNELKLRFPYQFKNLDPSALAFAPGWMPVIVCMCHEVDDVMEGQLQDYSFYWVLFKEKFGQPRFVYRFMALEDELGNKKGDSVVCNAMRERLMSIRHKAESLAREMCMVCGAPGELVDEPWMLTLCKRHEDAHRRGEHLR
jgi:hypothetical protein